MKTTKKLLAGALIAGTALAFGGCKQKTNTDSEEIAKTRDTDQRLGASNDRYDDSNKDSTLSAPATPPPETGSADLNGTDRLSGNAQAMNPPNRGTPQADTALNTQGDKSSPEIAHTGPQGSALAPNTDLVPPDNTLKGATHPTGPSPVNDQSKGMEMSRSTAFGQQGTDTTLAANDKATVKDRLNRAKDDLDKAKADLDKAVNKDLNPSDSDDPQAQREAAYGTAAERLAKLDSRVSEIRARVDNLGSNAAFTETLTDLRRLHETAQGALDQIRDRNVKLNDAREAADRQMTQFEAAINSVQKRIEKAASQT